MTGTFKLLSVLISLAMMLTGTYGVEAPEASARTLTLSDITLTVNDETVTLNPTLSLGAASEAGKALYDLAVNLDGKALFPVQLSVTEAALTALAKGTDVAVTLPATAIDSLTDSVAGQAVATGDPQAMEMVKVLSQELAPAYGRVLRKLGDPAFQKEMSARSQALMDQVAELGEGEPDVVEIEGNAYDVTTYEYTLENDQLMQLVDLVYASDEDLQAMYEALFKFYDMMPEESGLRGMHSFADLYETTGMEMTAHIVDRRNDDASVQVTDTQIALDFSRFIEKAAAQSGDGEAADVPELEPMVIDVHAEKAEGRTTSLMSADYAIQDVSMTMEGDTTQEEDLTTVDMRMSVDAGDEGTLSYDLSGAISATSRAFDLDVRYAGDGEGFDMGFEYNGGAQADTADWTYSVSADIDINDDDIAVDGALTAEGVNRGDGTAHADVTLGGSVSGVNLSLAFAADVATDPIEDAATGHDGLVIEDLEKVGELMQDEAAQGQLQQAASGFAADAGTLTQDESVARLVGLFQRLISGEIGPAEVEARPEQGPDEEPEAGEPEGIEDEDKGIDNDPETEYSDAVETDTDEAVAADPEDDGVLPYAEPTFGFLPEGMKILETDVDTAYDSVNITIGDDSYENIIIATFNPDRHEDGDSYILDADGKLVQTSGTPTQITRTDPGSWIATTTRDGVTAELYITSAGIDAETIANILNGLEF